MFIMKKEEVLHEIAKINDYLGKCMWMDFVLCQSNFAKIELFGAIDQSYNNYVDNYAIKIEFEQPHFVSSVFYWQADTSKPCIELVSEKEAYELNTKYQVEQGNYIFKINAENFENTPMLIAAKRITCKILNENPFSQ